MFTAPRRCAQLIGMSRGLAAVVRPVGDSVDDFVVEGVNEFTKCAVVGDL